MKQERRLFDRKDNTIELYPPKYYLFNTVKFIPTLYSTDWYIEPQGYEDTEQYLGMSDISNAPQEIVVSRNGLVDKVTGYVTNGGKVIYYDQYL